MDRYGLICRGIYDRPDITQRQLAQELDVSLGTINSLIKECIADGLISFRQEDGRYGLLDKGRELLERYRVDGAVIIAAGFGSRFVPLTFETPKGLLEVFGERMIERQIKQLHEADITDITIVVGYLKEKFEYLIDKYQVKLLYNPEYSCKNTLATVYQARKLFQGRNMYLLSSDNWMRNNMYRTYECGAWYSSVYMKGETSEWCLSYNKKGLISSVDIGGRDAWVMYGPAYFSAEFSDRFLPVLEAYYRTPGTEQFYWEHVFMDILNGEADHRLKEAGITMDIPGSAQLDIYVNRQPEDQVYEFENLEELRLFDQKYQNHSDNEAMELVSSVFNIEESEIQNIRCLKSGMTNKSFLFEIRGEHYICRIPGPGTEMLINRREEKCVYDTVAPLDITEHVIYFNGDTGYKISRYYEGVRNACADNWEDMEKCMALVHILHDSKLEVPHSFDIKERIDFYEKLCQNHCEALFEDYAMVRGWMNTLLDGLDQLGRPQVLSHLDSNVDNILILPDGTLRLIDWEYAGMCDPIVDISMCAIYSYYNEEDADRLLRVYLGREPEPQEEYAYYAYMALGGFLWSLWAVYKSMLGEEFGEYTIIMYRYAKNYYRKIEKDILRKL